MKTIKSGVLYNTVYQILLIIVPLITSPYLARVIGAEGIGEYQFSFSVAYYFFLFAMLGVNTYGNREVAKCRDSKRDRSFAFWQIYYIQCLLGIILSILYIILGKVSKQTSAIYYVQVLQILSVCVDVNWYAFALEEFKLTTIRSIIVKTLSTIMIFTFVKSNEDLVLYALIVLGSNLIGLCMIIPLVIQTTYYQQPDYNEIKKHLKPNFLLFLPSIASSIYIYMDKIMLGALANKVEVGFYNYAENIVAITYAFTTAISTVMLPRISYLIANMEFDKSKTYLNKSILYITALNFALAFGLDAIADVFIPWYLGDAYTYTAKLVIIRSPLIVLNGITVILKSQWLIPLNKDKEYSISIIIGAFVNAILNSLFIPRYGAVGASIATVISYLMISFVQIYYSREVLQIKKNLMDMIAFGFISLFMYFSIKTCNWYLLGYSSFLVIMIDFLIGILIYFSLISLYFRITNNNDYYKMKELLIHRIKR